MNAVCNYLEFEASCYESCADLYIEMQNTREACQMQMRADALRAEAAFIRENWDKIQEVWK